jgi:hypothetical protein
MRIPSSVPGSNPGNQGGHNGFPILIDQHVVTGSGFYWAGITPVLISPRWSALDQQHAGFALRLFPQHVQTSQHPFLPGELFRTARIPCLKDIAIAFPQFLPDIADLLQSFQLSFRWCLGTHTVTPQNLTLEIDGHACA